MLTLFGAGLLVGAVLLVIIPEGALVILSGQVHAALNEKDNDGDGVDTEALQGSKFYDQESVAKCLGLPMAIGFFSMALFDTIAKIVTLNASSSDSESKSARQ